MAVLAVGYGMYNSFLIKPAACQSIRTQHTLASVQHIHTCHAESASDAPLGSNFFGKCLTSCFSAASGVFALRGKSKSGRNPENMSINRHWRIIPKATKRRFTLAFFGQHRQAHQFFNRFRHLLLKSPTIFLAMADRCFALLLG